jgi:alcohol dehydrogenase
MHAPGNSVAGRGRNGRRPLRRRIVRTWSGAADGVAELPSAGHGHSAPQVGTYGTARSARPWITLVSSPYGKQAVVMRAVVYHSPGQQAWDEVQDPEITDEADVLIRVDATTICGSDLHILKGDVPSVTPGRILGHEAVGTVEQVGSSVRTLCEGDRVLVSCVSACGRCRFCREARYGQCREGGWILGRTFDGTQAEYARIPFADNSTYRLPAGITDEAALMLADILPTGYEVGVLNSAVRPGDVVVVVGSGPVGLAAIMGAQLFSPSHIIAIDLADSRLEAAKRFGADVTVNNSREDPGTVIRTLTEGLGADVAIEAVGDPSTFELAVKLVRPGGRIANIGLHGRSAVLHLEEQWTRDITITTGQVDTYSTPVLLRLVASGQLDPRQLVTHRFGFEDFAEAYDVFARAGDTGALKVVLSR